MRWTLTRLTALGVALVAAFVVAPSLVASRWPGSGGLADNSRFTADVRESITGYWLSGGPAFGPDLQRVVDYWFRYHVVKGVIAAALLVVLVAMGLRLWTTAGPRPCFRKGVELRRGPGVVWVCDGIVLIPVLYLDDFGVRPDGGWASAQPDHPF